MAMFLMNLLFYFLHPFLMMGVITRVQLHEMKNQFSPKKMYNAMKQSVYRVATASRFHFRNRDESTSQDDKK